MSSARRSWWSWRSLFSSLGNRGGSYADASSSSGTGTSSNTTASPVPEAQEASGARRGSSPTPLAKKPGEEKEGPAESSQSQPPPAPGKNRLSRRKAAPKSSKLKAKAQAQLGDGAPKKKSAPAPTPTPTQQEMRNKKRKRVATFERSWSRDDELRILEAMAKHANSHGGALPETSDLFAALGSKLDRRDADMAKLADKVHKLKRRYDNARLRGCPTDDDDDDDDDDDARQLFQLCEKVWGAPSTVLRRSTRRKIVVEDDVANLKGSTEQSKDVSQQAALKDKTARAKKRGPTAKAPYVRRELTELSVLYPSLAEEVKAHANDCGELIKAAFEFIGDDEARHLDARYKKMLMDKLNMKKEHADLTKSLLCTLTGFIN